MVSSNEVGFNLRGKAAPVSPYFMRQRQIPFTTLVSEGEPNWYIISLPGKVDMSKPDFTSYPVGNRNERNRL